MDELSKSPQVSATLTCACSEVIMKAQGGVEKIRAKVLIIKDNQTFAVCKGCNTEVLLPLMKSQDKTAPVSQSGPHLYLDK